MLGASGGPCGLASSRNLARPQHAFVCPVDNQSNREREREDGRAIESRYCFNATFLDKFHTGPVARLAIVARNAYTLRRSLVEESSEKMSGVQERDFVRSLSK